MKEISQDTNIDPIIVKKSIALVEMVGERGDPQGKNLHLLKRTQMMTIGQHRPEDLDLESMSARDAISLGHVVTQDQGDVVGMTHLKRRGDHVQKREKMNIDHPKKREGEMTLLHQHSMRKISPRTDLPSNLNQRQSMINKRLGHHCHLQQLRLQHLVNRHNCQLHKRYKCKLPNRHLHKLPKRHQHKLLKRHQHTLRRRHLRKSLQHMQQAPWQHNSQWLKQCVYSSSHRDSTGTTTATTGVPTPISNDSSTS